MKRVFKFSAFIALLFATNGTMGAEPKIIIDEAGKSIVLELDDPRLEHRVRFIDIENHIIYSGRVEKNELRDKKLDITNLPNGNYVLIVENHLRYIEFLINIEKSGASMVSKKIGFKPVFRKKEGRVYVNLLNSYLEPIHIEVRDAMDHLLFSETIDGTLNLAK